MIDDGAADAAGLAGVVGAGEARGGLRDRHGGRAAGAANVDIATLSRTAGRTANEDYADFLQAGPAGCWVIADGLGGHRGGATASRTVVQAALDSFRQQPDVSIEAVSAHIARAQDALLDAQQREPSLSQMRSTIVVLVAGDTEAVWAHVGDSRLYHVRGGTGDRADSRSFGRPGARRRRTDRRGGAGLARRSQPAAAMPRQGREAAAAISGPHSLARGDVFLLCTDGFWEALDDVALTVDLAGSEDAAAWLDRLEARLRRRIGPAHDNYTATAIRILNEAIPGPPPHDPRASARRIGSRRWLTADGDTARRCTTRRRQRDRRRGGRLAPRPRAPRLALAAAMVLVAALVIAGVWKRAVISAWMRALMAPAAAVTPSDANEEAAERIGDEAGPKSGRSRARSPRRNQTRSRRRSREPADRQADAGNKAGHKRAGAKTGREVRMRSRDRRIGTMSKKREARRRIPRRRSSAATPRHARRRREEDR